MNKRVHNKLLCVRKRSVNVELGFEVIKISLMTLGFLYVILKYNHDRLRSSSHENLKSLIGIYDKLHEHPDRLTCYGISLEELKDKGINVNHFIHLLKDITAGQLFYDTYPKSKNGIFPVGSYRHHLCSLEQTQLAWPYLRVFFGDTKYCVLFDNTISYFASECT